MPPQRAIYTDLRLFIVEPSKEIPVPEGVTRLGGRAECYYQGLVTLAHLGHFEAREALRIFRKKVREVLPLPPARAHEEIEGTIVAPIDLHPEKRWKLDLFGMLALQLLLWLWYARTHPYPQADILTKSATKLPDYDRNSVRNWLEYGRWLLHNVRPAPGNARRVRKLIPPSCRGSRAAENTYFLRCLRDRFRSFAPIPR